MNLSSGTTTDTGTVTVVFGFWDQPLQVAGWTVSQIRDHINGLWQCPRDAEAYINKSQVSDNHVLSAGETLVFHRPQGEKG